MKPLIYMISLFYRWYSGRKSTKDIAYESSILALELFVFMNGLSLLKLFNLWNGFSLESFSKTQLYPIIIIGAVAIGLIISFLAPKKKVIEIVSREQLSDYTLLVIYIVLSFILLIVAAKL